MTDTPGEVTLMEPVQDAQNDRAAVVCRCIAESLSLDAARVQLDSNLMDDFGADSLAFLDIVFRLEQEFGIQITRGEMERAAKGDMTDDEFAPSGTISEAGLDRLRLLIPESAHRIHPGLRPGQILGLFTVRTFFNMVEGKLRGETV
jgi:acyl carrier protein